jgi:basic membrane protein A
MKRFWHITTIGLVLSLFLVACAAPATPAPTAVPPTSAPAATAAPAATTAPSTPTLKIAMLTSGPVTDEGWNQLAYTGLQALKTQGYTVANTENVAQADQASDIESYINQGFNVIVGHGFEYADALTAAAAKHPTDYFIQIGGIAKGANLKSYVFKPGEGGYVSGVLAAKMSKAGKFGFVGAVKIPTIEADELSFEQAIKAATPSATIVQGYSNDFSDINTAHEAALAQISAGVDVILANGDNANVGAINAVKEKGPNVLVIGWTLDQSHLAPNNVMMSVVQRVDVLLEQAIGDIQAGKFQGGNVVVGFTEGISDISPFGPMVPADVQTAVKQAVADLKAGKVNLPPIPAS